MRRYKELTEKGVEVKYEDVLREMIERDENDRSRAVAPAIPAEDAIIFDNSDYDLEGSIEKVIEIIKEKVGDFS